MNLASCLDAIPEGHIPVGIADGDDIAMRICDALNDLECLRFEDAAGIGM